MLNRVRDALFDRKTDLQSRLFLLLGVIALSGMVMSFFTGMAIGENIESLGTVFGGFIVLLSTTILGYRLKRLNTTANLIACLMVFFFFPTVYFTSGGIYGGPPLWFLFSIVFISMILRGWIRIFMLISQILSAVACYAIEYYSPWMVIPHSRDEFFEDSLSSLVIIGFILSVLMIFQIYVYTRENEISNAQTEEINKLNRAQSRFFSSMSHEIRTPINTIIGLNEMILREDVSEEVAENAENIQAASKILLSLINDILDMSRIESGRMVLKNEDFSFSKLLSLKKLMSDIYASGVLTCRCRRKGNGRQRHWDNISGRCFTAIRPKLFPHRKMPARPAAFCLT